MGCSNLWRVNLPCSITADSLDAVCWAAPGCEVVRQIRVAMQRARDICACFFIARKVRSNGPDAELPEIVPNFSEVRSLEERSVLFPDGVSFRISRPRGPLLWRLLRRGFSEDPWSRASEGGAGKPLPLHPPRRGRR